jgi:hypothetical protein
VEPPETAEDFRDSACRLLRNVVPGNSFWNISEERKLSRGGIAGDADKRWVYRPAHAVPARRNESVEVAGTRAAAAIPGLYQLRAIPDSMVTIT